MESKITATEAARHFSDVLNRVRYRGETFVVERAGEPICRIVPAGTHRNTVRDLVEFFRGAPHVDDEYLGLVESLTKNQPPMPKSPWRRRR